MSFLFTSNSQWLAQSRYSINTLEWISERITSAKIFTLTLYKNYFYQCHQSPHIAKPSCPFLVLIFSIHPPIWQGLRSSSFTTTHSFSISVSAFSSSPWALNVREPQNPSGGLLYSSSHGFRYHHQLPNLCLRFRPPSWIPDYPVSYWQLHWDSTSNFTYPNSNSYSHHFCSKLAPLTFLSFSVDGLSLL